jgi:hypothetical protein
MAREVNVYATEHYKDSVRRYLTGTVTVETDMRMWTTYEWETPGVGKFYVNNFTFHTEITVPQLKKAISLDNEAGVADSMKDMCIDARNRVIAEILDSADSSINWFDLLEALKR